MQVEIWHMVLLLVVWGLWTEYRARNSRIEGISHCLDYLINMKVIEITDDGEIRKAREPQKDVDGEAA